MFEAFISFINRMWALIMSVLISVGIMSPGPVILETSQKKVMDIPADGIYHIVEGGCTDGKYIYLSMLDSNKSDDPESVIYKINPNTGRIIARAAGLHIDHSNDMTYNSKRRQLVICNNMPHRNIITYFDTDKMEIINSITINTDLFAIDYVPSSDTYYCGIANSYNFAEFTNDFRVIRTFTGINNGYTRQALTVHDGSVYHVFYNTNCIFRYDMNGNYTGRMDLPVATDEAEDLFFIGNTLYVTYNILGKENGGAIYKVENPVFEGVPVATPTDA